MSDESVTLRDLMAVVQRCPEEELAKLNSKQCLQLITDCSPDVLAIVLSALLADHSDDPEFVREFWSRLSRDQVANLLQELPMVRQFEGDDEDEE